MDEWSLLFLIFLLALALAGIIMLAAWFSSRCPYICPFCGKRAEYHGTYKIEEFNLDPLLNDMGVCINPACINSVNYPLPPDSDEKAWTALEKKRTDITGYEYGVLACPACKEWKLQVIEDSGPGCFSAKCANCQKELFMKQS